MGIEPYEQAAKSKQWVRNYASIKLGVFTKNNRKYCYSEDRLQCRPGNTDHRLFIADLYITQSEEIKQFAMTPNVCDIKADPRTARFDICDLNGFFVLQC